MITPHKGGRTEFVSGFRFTPTEKANLKKVLAAREMSLADWVSEKVTEDLPMREINITIDSVSFEEWVDSPDVDINASGANYTARIQDYVAGYCEADVTVELSHGQIGEDKISDTADGEDEVKNALDGVYGVLANHMDEWLVEA